MSNLNAALGLSLSYKNEEGTTTTMPAISVTCAYTAQCHGEIDVPIGATGEIPIPFGSVDTGATCIIVKNKTAQDVELKINGQNVVSHHHNLAAGGVFVYGGPTMPDANPILSMSATLAGTQIAAGSISFHIFGDPV